MKKAINTILVIIICIVSVEISFRLVLSVKFGSDIFYYGTRKCKNQAFRQGVDWIGLPSNKDANHFLYEPGERKKHFDEDGNLYSTFMNKYGLRGRNFTTEKDDGIIRVVALGASSTFGLYNRDNETYPFILDSLLNLESEIKYEVLNFGVPHYKSEQVYSLFMSEVLKLKPDYVLYYQGSNDCDIDNYSKYKKSKIRKILRGRLILFKFLTEIGKKKYTQQDLIVNKQQIIDDYIKNINLISEECKKNDVCLIIANQQTCSLRYSQEELANIGYNEEENLILDRLRDKQQLNLFEINFLLHAEMMRSLESWVLKEGIEFVNFIEKTNSERQCLLTWVHLSKDANIVLANEFKNHIRQK